MQALASAAVVEDYLVVAGLVVSLVLGSLLLARRIRSSVVRCGFCGHRVMPWALRSETFTCRPCKKTLPRRLAYPTPAQAYTAAKQAGDPEWSAEPSARVLESVGRHRKTG